MPPRHFADWSDAKKNWNWSWMYHLSSKIASSRRKTQTKREREREKESHLKKLVRGTLTQCHASFRPSPLQLDLSCLGRTEMYRNVHLLIHICLQLDKWHVKGVNWCKPLMLTIRLHLMITKWPACQKLPCEETWYVLCGHWFLQVDWFAFFNIQHPFLITTRASQCYKGRTISQTAANWQLHKTSSHGHRVWTTTARHSPRRKPPGTAVVLQEPRGCDLTSFWM